MISGGSRTSTFKWKFTCWRNHPIDRQEKRIYTKSYRQWLKRYLDRMDYGITD